MTTILDSLKIDIERLEAKVEAAVGAGEQKAETDWKSLAVEAHQVLLDIVPAYYDARAGVTEAYDRARVVIAKVKAAL